jgi:tripartite-type tricarboxylate transporter receptor subunit TctC
VDKLFGRSPKATRADFIPLARLCADPVLVLINDQQPYNTLAEFVDAAKKNPEKIVYSSGGFYGASHLPVALLEQAAGLKGMRHLPTAGGGPAITAALGNNAQLTTQTVQATLSHVKAGKLRALATFGAARSKSLPDVPTMRELGYDVTYYLWVGLFAPKGTPAPIVSTLTTAIDKAAASPQFNDPLANLGLEPSYLAAAEFAKFWDEDVKRSEETIRQIGKVG